MFHMEVQQKFPQGLARTSRAYTVRSATSTRPAFLWILWSTPKLADRPKCCRQDVTLADPAHISMKNGDWSSRFGGASSTSVAAFNSWEKFDCGSLLACKISCTSLCGCFGCIRLLGKWSGLDSSCMLSGKLLHCFGSVQLGSLRLRVRSWPSQAFLWSNRQ